MFATQIRCMHGYNWPVGACLALTHMDGAGNVALFSGEWCCHQQGCSRQ